MAIRLISATDDYVDHAFNIHPEHGGTHVLVPVDDLPELAADIHRVVLGLAVHGASPHRIDAAIVDLLRGTTPDAARVPAVG